MQSTLFEGGLLRDAVLSSDGAYRYVLTRTWAQSGRKIAFVCLNPSTADAHVDDPTVRKCMRLAAKWGGGCLSIVNLFAFRSTDPSRLRLVDDPIGPDNDDWLSHTIGSSDVVVAAWGCHGTLRGRNEAVLERFRGRFQALRLTRDGHPSHPLYLPEHLVPVRFER
jgi:hypothetical protein